jgi:pyruvate kinase
MYPVEALKTMVKIAIRTEQDINYTARFKMRHTLSNPDITNAISHATCTTAIDLNAAAIITVTQSGKTARMISKYRPDCNIIGGSMHQKVCRQLNLSWGVTPLEIQKKEDADELFEHAVDTAAKAGLVSMGDITVITAGVPLGVSGTTNILKVHVAGHILATGRGINDKVVSANICVCRNAEDLKENFKEGDVIVARETNNDMMEQIRKSSGMIIEEGGFNSHAVIAGLSLDIPVIIDVEHATAILKTGAYVTLDAKEGIVSCNG